MNIPQFTEEQFEKFLRATHQIQFDDKGRADSYLTREKIRYLAIRAGYIVPVKEEGEPLIVHNVMSYKGKNYLKQFSDTKKRLNVCSPCCFQEENGICELSLRANCRNTNFVWKSFDDIIIDDNLACSRKDIGDIYLKGALDDPFILCKIQEDEAIIHLPRIMDKYRTQSTPKEHLRLATAEELQEYLK